MLISNRITPLQSWRTCFRSSIPASNKPLQVFWALTPLSNPNRRSQIQVSKGKTRCCWKTFQLFSYPEYFPYPPLPGGGIFGFLLWRYSLLLPMAAALLPDSHIQTFSCWGQWRQLEGCTHISSRRNLTRPQEAVGKVVRRAPRRRGWSILHSFAGSAWQFVAQHLHQPVALNRGYLQSLWTNDCGRCSHAICQLFL